MFVIAGLGNPGKKYEKTRHNVGFQVIDRLADKYHINMNLKKHKAVCGVGMIEGNKVFLMKPQTFMNLSGESIQEAVSFYKTDPETELLIIYDDISLPPGQIRIRKKGSAGGHNGVKSIIGLLGTQAFMRIKVGVGEKPEGYDLADYVLGHFNEDDRALIAKSVEQAAQAAEVMITEGADKAMNLFNKKGTGKAGCISGQQGV